MSERCQNTLIVPTSKEVGSVKQSYFIIYIFIQLHLNNFIITN